MIVVSALEAVESVAVTVLTLFVPLSSMVAGVCTRVTVPAGTSSSVMVTTLSSVVPAVTPSGKVPNDSLTLSPSSSTSSAVAAKVKLFSVSPLAKFTLSGTPL